MPEKLSPRRSSSITHLWIGGGGGKLIHKWAREFFQNHWYTYIDIKNTDKGKKSKVYRLFNWGKNFIGSTSGRQCIIPYLGWQAIRDMNTRGAPAIAITGCLALAVELVNLDFDSISAFDQFVTEKLGLARNCPRVLV